MKVLFVCLANICRSPAGADILRHLVKSGDGTIDCEIDSCAVTSWSIGDPPNPQMSAVLTARGIAVTAGKARRIQPHDFEQCDYILAVTEDVAEQLRALVDDPKQKQKVRTLGEFGQRFRGLDIPDPYALDDATFEKVVDMLQDTCEGFLAHLRKPPA